MGVSSVGFGRRDPNKQKHGAYRRANNSKRFAQATRRKRVALTRAEMTPTATAAECVVKPDTRPDAPSIPPVEDLTCCETQTNNAYRPAAGTELNGRQLGVPRPVRCCAVLTPTLSCCPPCPCARVTAPTPATTRHRRTKGGEAICSTVRTPLPLATVIREPTLPKRFTQLTDACRAESESRRHLTRPVPCCQRASRIARPAQRTSHATPGNQSVAPPAQAHALWDRR